ncbi:hypothetical protein LIER_19211 [Lithospermum erythrorhizon]|uniref:CASP-like protein n=1 Tax=Lithospermum erythrorhizon TaxID=34254 RepID=A0AAV3QHW7_LITER
MTMHPHGNVDAVSPKVLPTTTTPPVGAGKTGDMENKTTLEGFGVSNIVQKWRRDDLLKKGSLSLCVASLIFSLIALIIMASNKHGDWKNYNKYEEYRYVLAIAIISTLYSGLQAILQLNDLSGRELILKHDKMILDFFGDQLLAYLLLSAASSAVPLTNRMREKTDNIFTDSSAAAISMEFFAFFAMALSALISGYKLCNQSYI